jgi:hypothetical protein
MIRLFTHHPITAAWWIFVTASAVAAALIQALVR